MPSLQEAQDALGRLQTQLGSAWGRLLDLLAFIGLSGDYRPDEVLLLGAFGVALLAVLKMGIQQGTSTDKPRKHRDTPTLERFLTWLWPPPDPCPVGHIVASFRHLPHWIVFGAPGSGKSTFMRMMILEPLVGLPGLVYWLVNLLIGGRWRLKRKGKLIITGNLSKPFRAAVLWLIEHGYPAVIWTPNPKPDEGFGLDVLESPAENVGEMLIAMQPVGVGNTGLRSGAVEGMIVDTVYTLRRNGKQVDFENILTVIPTVGIRDLDHNGKPTGNARPLTANERAGLEDWCTRLRTLRRRMGGSIGSDLKISEALKAGYAVLIECSSYNNPNSTEPLINLFVYLSMWLVGAVSNFNLIIDEPGAVGPGTFTRLLSATRAHGVHITIGMQSRKQVDDTLREMCTTALLLGAAGDAPEARDFESKVVDHDVPPEDFVLLEPPRWYEFWMFLWPRRGLKSCNGWFFSNGRLDLVSMPYCNLSILKRWPSGSIPKLAHRRGLPEVPPDSAGTHDVGAGPAEKSPGGTSQTGSSVNVHTVWEAYERRVRGEEPVEAKAAEAEVAEVAGPRVWGDPVWFNRADADRVRVYSKMKRESCGCLRWTADSDNGSGRPKTHMMVEFIDLSGSRKRKKTSPTVYVLVYEWVHGAGSAKPSVDHLCHTNDDRCPGNKPCDNPECDNPMHPYGDPCLHTYCCEVEHLEGGVALQENHQRSLDQQRRYMEWHEGWLAERAIASVT